MRMTCLTFATSPPPSPYSNYLFAIRDTDLSRSDPDFFDQSCKMLSMMSLPSELKGEIINLIIKSQLIMA